MAESEQSRTRGLLLLCSFYLYRAAAGFFRSVDFEFNVAPISFFVCLFPFAKTGAKETFLYYSRNFTAFNHAKVFNLCQIKFLNSIK